MSFSLENLLKTLSFIVSVSISVYSCNIRDNTEINAIEESLNLKVLNKINICLLDFENSFE